MFSKLSTARSFVNQRMISAIKEELTYFRKWIIIAILIGVACGFTAIVFYHMVEHATHHLLTNASGYKPPKAGLPREHQTYSLPSRRYLIPVITGVGGLLCGLLVYSLAPEAEGHGTDAAIESFHYKRGIVRGRVPLVKIIASAITIGSGGSAGKEGPVAQVGSGIASLLAKLFKLNSRERRIAVAIGVGSGIAAIFKAPLGGAIFASEVLYLMDFEPEVIPPAFIASFISYVIMCYFTGWGHIFHVPSLKGELFKLYGLTTITAFMILGILNGIFGILYVKSFYGVRHIFLKLKIPKFLKPAVGGVITGIIGAFTPHVLETSYGWLQMLICGGIEEIPLTILLLLPFLKIAATSFSVGSGGSGGVFAPALFIGGSLGALMWVALKHVLPSYDIPLAVFTIIGMMSFFGGVGKVPIASILMVSEMTGEYELLPAALIATALSYIITGENTIYISQVPTRAESPAYGASKLAALHKLKLILEERESKLLSLIKARNVMRVKFVKFNVNTPLRLVLEEIKRRPHGVYPVVDCEDKVLGFLRLEDIPFEDPKAMLELKVKDLPLYPAVIIQEDDDLNRVIDEMIKNSIDKVIVVDEEGRVRGIVAAKDVVRYLILKEGLW